MNSNYNSEAWNERFQYSFGKPSQSLEQVIQRLTKPIVEIIDVDFDIKDSTPTNNFTGLWKLTITHYYNGVIGVSID